jgi:hypothetical protein
MGIRLFNRSASTYEEPHERKIRKIYLPNPDPNNYEIISSTQVGSTLILEICYPDCKNYEGHKIMLYKNTTLDNLKIQGSIDPHFCNNPNKKSPFLRIEPTKEGLDMAIHVAVTIERSKK